MAKQPTNTTNNVKPGTKQPVVNDKLPTNSTVREARMKKPDSRPVGDQVDEVNKSAMTDPNVPPGGVIGDLPSGVEGGDKVVDERDPDALLRCEVLNANTIINGHKLAAGTVVELYPDEIDNHRNRGVALGDVKDDDERESFDVQTPYVADEDGGE